MTVLLGRGGHGTDLAATYYRVHGTHIKAYDHDASLGMLPDNDAYDQPCYIGVNDPIKRSDLAHQYVLYGAEPLIDPSAEVGPDCHFAPGVVIGPHSVLLADVTLGRHVHCHYMVSMTRCAIGEFTTVCPAATLCGDIEIGKECLIGASSVICNLVTLGNRVTIGAGAIVPPNSNVPDDTVVVGVYKS